MAPPLELRMFLRSLKGTTREAVHRYLDEYEYAIDDMIEELDSVDIGKEQDFSRFTGDKYSE